MQHEVKFSIPERELGKADIEFSVRENSQKLGRMKISRGSIVWVPTNATYGYQMTWNEFNTLMRDNGKHEKGTK